MAWVLAVCERRFGWGLMLKQGMAYLLYAVFR